MDKKWWILFCCLAIGWPDGSRAQIAPIGSGAFGVSDRSSGLGLTRDYNPAIGANLLMGGEYLSKEAESLAWPDAVKEALGQTGVFFQEAEVGFAAAVDPFFRADLIIALHRHEGHFHVDLEEGYVTTLALPQVTLRAGKFYLPFGRHNVLHTHAFPFIDAPWTHTVFFGEEGLNEMAIEAAVLLPLPWFAELSAYAANGDNEVLFHSPKGRDLAYGGRLHTLVEFSDSVTADIGGNYVAGKNIAGGWTHVFGGDLTLRWRPAGRELYHQLVWQSEYLQVRRTGPLPSPTAGTDAEAQPDEGARIANLQSGVPSGTGGFYTYLAGQVAREWWLQARFDAVGYPRPDAGPRLHRVSGLLAFVPSEFSAIRLQYSYGFGREERVHQVLLQLNVTIGAHPAHAY